MAESFRTWKEHCERVLARKFPPDTSDFDAATLTRDASCNFSRLRNWEIVCQEVLDTEFSHVYLRGCYDELRRRGKSDADIQAMRAFAWHTAGWLNFGMMVWDWVSLDESDIERAIAELFSRGQISSDERADMLKFMRRHA